MIEVINYANSRLYKRTLSSMYQLRHEIFVRKLRWKNVGGNDIEERDQFDTDNSIYLVLTDENGLVEASCRLTPTTQPNLLKDEFRFLCKKDIPSQSNVFELTRVCASKSENGKYSYNQRVSYLMCGIVEFCYKSSIENILFFTDMKKYTKYVRLWSAKPLGDPCDIGGEICAAANAPMDEKSLISTRRQFGVKEKSIVSYFGPMPVNNAIFLASEQISSNQSNPFESAFG